MSFFFKVRHGVLQSEKVFRIRFQRDLQMEYEYNMSIAYRKWLKSYI